jgi:hypothetical protein
VGLVFVDSVVKFFALIVASHWKTEKETSFLFSKSFFHLWVGWFVDLWS